MFLLGSMLLGLVWSVAIILVEPLDFLETKELPILAMARSIAGLNFEAIISVSLDPYLLVISEL